MKRTWPIIPVVVIGVLGAKFGFEYLQTRAGTIEAIKANSCYIQIVKAMDKYVDQHHALPRALAELRFESAPPDLEGFDYVIKGNGQCRISYRGKHGYFGHPLDFGEAVKTNAPPP